MRDGAFERLNSFAVPIMIRTTFGFSSEGEQITRSFKRWMDQSYFLLRGQEKVSAEASLTILAYNLRRAINILGVSALVRAVT